jgi:hypothetical protein
MRRPIGLAAVLVVAMAPGCGYSMSEVKEPRDPPGGRARGPDVNVETVDRLRAVEITVAANRFQPAQASVGLDATVRIQNESDGPVELRLIKRVGRRLPDLTLEPGERIEREYLRGGTEVFGLERSRARLQINVFPSP